MDNLSIKEFDEEKSFNLTKLSFSKNLYLVIRRGLDTIIAIFLLLILSPLLISVSLLIKIESPGPILFKQKRIGKSGNQFTIYKFRSMHIDAPIKPSNDFKDSKQHITKLGNILRKTSIDELPQLINVIKGEMSLIGPRPVIPLESDLLFLRELYGVDNLPPGLTGWAQVNGRTHITNKEKAYYDKVYYEKISPIFDIYIIFRTIIHLISGGQV